MNETRCGARPLRSARIEAGSEAQASTSQATSSRHRYRNERLAPRAKVRACSGVSRLRSLRSPLRGLDAPSARPRDGFYRSERRMSGPRQATCIAPSIRSTNLT